MGKSVEQRQLLLVSSTVFNVNDHRCSGLGFILYLIGYVLITLFSDYEDLQTYRYLCGTRPINQSNRLNFTEEKCFGPILSTLILT